MSGLRIVVSSSYRTAIRIISGDLDRGNPYIITSFPAPESVMGYQKMAPDPKRLIEETLGDDYIVLTQRPGYRAEAGWKNETERPDHVQINKLRLLRPYQLRAIHALQRHASAKSFLYAVLTARGDFPELAQKVGAGGS